eukprot:3158508-Amphidinium_carterae.1
MFALVADAVPGKPLRIIVYIDANDISSTLLDKLGLLKDRAAVDLTFSEELHTQGTLTAESAMVSFQSALGELMFAPDVATKPATVDISSQAVLAGSMAGSNGCR